MATFTEDTMAKKQATAAEKRNPQDITVRNARAAGKRLTLIEDQLGALATTLGLLAKRIEAIEAQTNPASR